MHGLSGVRSQQLPILRIGIGNYLKSVKVNS
jgi:hypothetical protein